MNDPRVGTLLEGRYLVGRRLAHGGTATVHLGHDQRLDRPVALKLMHPQLSHDPKFVARAQREARSAARLHHPNVVSVLDQGHAEDGTLYLVLEYVDGPTLRSIVTEEAPMPPRRVLQLLVPVLRGLAEAHRQGLVHRDVKPENVLLTSGGDVKVADFGLMRAVDEHTDTTTVMGTVGYAAPELVSADTVDQRTDVYSVGIMAYEMLTGSRPYTGSALQVAHSHVSRDVPVPSRSVGGVPPGLDELVLRATARDPRQRPPHAASLLDTALAVQRTLPPEAVTGLDAVPTEVLGSGGEDVPHDPDATQVLAPGDDPDATHVLGPSRSPGPTARAVMSTPGADDARTRPLDGAPRILPAFDQDVTGTVSVPIRAAGSSASRSPAQPSVRLNPRWSAVQIAMAGIGFVLLLSLAGVLGWVIGAVPVASAGSSPATGLPFPGWTSAAAATPVTGTQPF